MNVTRFIPFISIVLLLNSCGLFNTAPSNYLPRFMGDVQWEMTVEQIRESRSLELAHERSFRNVYLENTPSAEELERVVYYFAVSDGRTNHPLYEVIMDFKDPVVRDRYADDLFGDPNTQDGEWRWTEDGVSYRAWTFESKLIVVKVIPGCEWDE